MRKKLQKFVKSLALLFAWQARINGFGISFNGEGQICTYLKLLFCFKVALRLWFCRSIDHIIVLNQSRVLLVCLTLFLCEAKWHLLLDLLFVFCTKKSWQKKTGVWSQNVSLPKSRQAQKSYNYPHNPPHGAPAKKRPEKWRRGQRRQQQPQW